VNLSEFKKIVAAWPDHEGDGAFDEDAQVWVETGRNRSSPVARVTRLGQHDLYIATRAFETPEEPATDLAGENAKLRALLRDFATNWDCDNDGHRYNTGCRTCRARETLKEVQSK